MYTCRLQSRIKTKTASPELPKRETGASIAGGSQISAMGDWIAKNGEWIAPLAQPRIWIRVWEGSGLLAPSRPKGSRLVIRAVPSTTFLRLLSSGSRRGSSFRQTLLFTASSVLATIMALKPCTICRLSRYAVAYAKTKANWHPANHSGVFSSLGLQCNVLVMSFAQLDLCQLHIQKMLCVSLRLQFWRSHSCPFHKPRQQEALSHSRWLFPNIIFFAETCIWQCLQIPACVWRRANGFSCCLSSCVGVHNCKKEPSASQVSGLGATYNFSFASQPILKVSSKASGFGFFDSPRIAANKSLPKGYPSFAAKPVSQKHEVVREAEKKQDCKARPRPAPLPLLEFASLGTQGKGASQPTADLRIAPSTKAWKLYSGVVNKQQKKKTQKDSKGKQDALLAFARMSM